MDMIKTVFALSEAVGPCGRESEATRLAAELLRPYVDSVTTDVSGNLIGIRTAKQRGAKCILLDAHLDEVCLYVTDHHKGFLKFEAIGVDPRILPGLEVKICTEPPVFGVINCLPPHILTAEEREKAFEMDKLRIDCGLTQEEAVAKIPVGTPVVYATKPFLMGEKTVCGKSLDDRACFATLIRTMELLKDEPLPVDVCVLGSVQEEYTGAGAATGAYNMLPDRAIAVDVTFGDTPDSDKKSTFPLGKGPTVGVGPRLNRKMYRDLLAVAKEKDIPAAKEILARDTGTNADDMQISREGIAVATVSLPLRYMHTPIETVSLDDIEYTAQLLAAYILTLKEDA